MDTASQWLANNLAAVIVAIAQANATLGNQPVSGPGQQAQPSEAGGDE